VREVHVDGDLEVARRDGADVAIALADLDRLADHQPAAHAALRHDAGLLDQVHERRRAAVHDRDLGAVDLDRAVVDAHAAQRGEHVLDRGETRAMRAQRGRQRRVDDPLGTSGQTRLAREILAHEQDAGAGRGGAQNEVNGPAGVKPDAGALHLVGKRPLAIRRAAAAQRSTALCSETLHPWLRLPRSPQHAARLGADSIRLATQMVTAITHHSALDAKLAPERGVSLQ
jgi:hypothetical protein